MSKALAAIKAKLDRADESLRTLDDELTRISNGKPFTVRGEMDSQPGWYTAYIDDAKPLPAICSVLIGESLYHGRSALEHLVWALVKANHKKPGKEHTFPIWEKPKRMKGSPSDADSFIKITKRKELAGVPIAAITLIESLQPYKRTHPSLHVLTFLNKMARDDRHHALHASYAMVWDNGDLIEPLFQPHRGYRITEFRNLAKDGKRVVRGTKLARFRVVPVARNPKVGVEGNLPVHIAFGKPNSVVFGVFKDINEALGRIVEQFSEFL